MVDWETRYDLMLYHLYRVSWFNQFNSPSCVSLSTEDPLERRSMINLNDIPYRHTAFLLHPPSPLIGEMGGVLQTRLRFGWLFCWLRLLVAFIGCLGGVILLVKLGFVGLLAVTWFWCANIVRRR